MPGRNPIRVPVETIVGGERHGYSFLARVHDLDGASLARAPLVETRYLHYAPNNQLALSPGFPKDKPVSFDTALGRVLPPKFGAKCLACHGEPRTEGAHMATGVSCESCHGPGQNHLPALGRKSEDKGILNPAKLPVAQQMQPCSQCHAGFSNVQDAMPDDLLISDQVTALSNSECWRQSGGRITCVQCHDPHQDAPRAALVAKSEAACLGCHSEQVANRPALCPVNRTTGCVGCHMPESDASAPFRISDHWIRVHPDNATHEHRPEWQTQIKPNHLFLRVIELDDQTKAQSIKEQLDAGASFFDLARANSLDRASAMNGGYLGDLEAAQFNAPWSAAAAALPAGGHSSLIENHRHYFIVGRMPRNFREEAEARFNHALEMRNAANPQGAAAELLEALKIYPRLLRALTYLGITYAEGGNPQTGAGILTLATKLYPQDAGAHFNLALAYGATRSEDEIGEYKKALEIDPDYVPAYLNWGAALQAQGQYQQAIEIYRKGIEVNPLVASLHYSLSVTLDHQGQTQQARDEMTLAIKLDSRLAEKQ
jgi:predicted CXXCH cytochrome family protein